MNNPFQMPTNFSYPYQAPYQYPYQQQPTPQPDSFSGIMTVSGLEGARSCIVPPNSMVLLMDDQNDRFWVKRVDQSGIATLQEYEFREVEPPKESNVNYVSVEEFNKLQKDFDKLKEQYELNIRQETAKTTTKQSDEW